MLNRYEKIRIVVAVDNGSVDYTYGKVIVGRIMYAHHIGFFPFSECEISSLIVKGGVMLMSSAEEKTGECVVCCHRCGAFLMESASTTSYMVCPECGARLVVCVKKGKVSVFDDTRSEEELAKKRHACLTRYAAKINEITK